MNEQRYQDILVPLQKGKQYTLAELSSVIHTLRPQLSPRGYSWILSHLVQQGSLKRIKEGIYLRDDTLKIYDSGSLPKVG
jgi:predicted transcriptional regulator of viral defense system